MTNAEALEQGLMKLVAPVAVGRATGKPDAMIVDDIEALVPELGRLRGEAWLEGQARTMEPRKPRFTSGVIRRAAAGDPEAQRLVRERREQEAARGRRGKAVAR